MSRSDPNTSRSWLRRLRADKRGVAAVEFALASTALAFLFLGLLETSRFLMLYLKAQHAAVTVADLVTRDKKINEAQITDMFNVVTHVMAPFPVGGQSSVIVSAMGRPTGQPASIYWQRTGAGSLSSVSAFGTQGSTITALPGGLTLRDDQTLVTVELFYQYQPWVFDIFGSYTIRRLSYFRPRIGALTQVDP